ncbi:MAG: cysteine--tRNA ligase [Novosphingobium sp.]|uniref:cysteine--tRNA ligase n=1 Tax=Novosphingobium sp. TaxID=1874826 RepID=UPI0032BD0F3E
MTDGAQLKLFNSLTRQMEPFQPVHPGEARVYSCGPTVYNYQHIGNMRAYVFADTLGRVLRFKGYDLKHIINITDVGHLTSDADAGDDKMEKAAALSGKTAWDIAAFYTAEFKRDLNWLNVTPPAKWTVATDYVPAMIDYAKSIAEKHCYELESGLYFDVSTVPEYGRLARAVTDDGEGRIEDVNGKRSPADFAIWRKTPLGETRQMEWDSPWGKGAPGWHLECSVMSAAELGMPFDIHTGGIDHREIHHPNEIAQNQAHEGCAHTGASIWMHNNFLIDRGGKMSKSAGEFLRLQTLVDRGYHPLAYRMMCLQAHYRSELEFSWEGLGAALVRLKRLVMGVEKIDATTKTEAKEQTFSAAEAMSIVHYGHFAEALSDDLNTPLALTEFENVIAYKQTPAVIKLSLIREMDRVLGFDFTKLTRQDLRIRPKTATITEPEIEAALAQRKDARAARDFATSDRLRDELAAQGVEVMDGDPLGWDWKLS